MSTRSIENSTKAPFWFWTVDFNSCCGCPRRHPWSAPKHLPGHGFRKHPVIPSITLAHAQVYSASTHLRYVFTVQTINMNLNNVVNIVLNYVQWQIRSLGNVPTHMVEYLLFGAQYSHTVCRVLYMSKYYSEVLDHSVRMHSITAGWGAMNCSFAYDWELTEPPRSALGEKTWQAAALFCPPWVRVWRLRSGIPKQRMRHMMIMTCGGAISCDWRRSNHPGCS